MTTPKFAQIKQFIVDKIKNGSWQEDQRVPSENELSSQFSVSRMTARRALSELTDAGILTRSQGLGTFVASFKSQSSLLEIKNIADEVKERNGRYSCSVHILESINAIAPIAIALGVEIDSVVYRSVLVHNENEKPLQVEERFVNPELAKDYLQQDFTLLTPHEYLSNVAPLTQARHTVEAIMPNNEMCQWLNLYNEEPCLQVIRRTWSSKGIVSFARLVSPGSKYRLGGHLTFKK
ncbi:histidine utilization repressor [Pseudoalteromonas carrageenovora]|jgi:GntR family transcriptional regulator, histidine utilization repressor|uniref:Histidine utilization repressor n=1 Tax=Pseudoalteromonas carrageenovora IAM 12662 TaxID=1314868 RepID=A0A2K4X5M4_PSEVC|nr:histidine utilization repressor [Pseudoalteromonas carrageenovora]MBE0381820.1 GntR family transcriptional regulator, histidine utilization repressor [Pseudoalteromonas carrageenovora IAM 12662]MCQ8890575.1 histidine utilization repressor [Pseudoalteromonas carrageenovora]MDO6463773.1 histidine utilization repressor [Pseudoalteromonas carrageenovora]MDO6547377.1 histidine utilization repressor [Pseudoalteromonas carrageenovora]MDO6831825.1 histidine utilization repressor [Pseudoalteromonas 